MASNNYWQSISVDSLKLNLNNSIDSIRYDDLLKLFQPAKEKPATDTEKLQFEVEALRRSLQMVEHENKGLKADIEQLKSEALDERAKRLSYQYRLEGATRLLAELTTEEKKSVSQALDHLEQAERERKERAQWGVEYGTYGGSAVTTTAPQFHYSAGSNSPTINITNPY